MTLLDRSADSGRNKGALALSVYPELAADSFNDRRRQNACVSTKWWRERGDRESSMGNLGTPQKPNLASNILHKWQRPQKGY